MVDFSMTALDYLKSKERNIEIGRQDSTRSWQPNITITLADNTVYPYKGYVDLQNRRLTRKPVRSPFVPKCLIRTEYCCPDSYESKTVVGRTRRCCGSSSKGRYH